MSSLSCGAVVVETKDPRQRIFEQFEDVSDISPSHIHQDHQAPHMFCSEVKHIMTI